MVHESVIFSVIIAEMAFVLGKVGQLFQDMAAVKKLICFTVLLKLSV